MQQSQFRCCSISLSFLNCFFLLFFRNELSIHTRSTILNLFIISLCFLKKIIYFINVELGMSNRYCSLDHSVFESMFARVCECVSLAIGRWALVLLRKPTRQPGVLEVMAGYFPFFSIRCRFHNCRNY